MSLSTVLAKALFDNAAESPEELAFRKGDILMVLEQEQEGGPGWWLCSLHGRQGIAPANRLRLLQTAAAPTPVLGACRTPSVDSVYLSPGQQARANGLCVEDEDGVYLSPPGVGDGVYQSPGGASGLGRQGDLWQAEGTRPRSHSSSGPRLRPDWPEVGSEGRPRSPSLRGRSGEAASLYQTPASPAPLAARYRSQGALVSEMVYLTPSAMARQVGEVAGEAGYLRTRETGVVGQADGCYLVPRPAAVALPREDVYQTPASGAQVAGQCASALAARLQDSAAGSQDKAGQEGLGMYQSPIVPATGRTPQTERKLPSGSAVVLPTSGQNLKQAPGTPRVSPRPQGPCATPPMGREKLSQAAVRGSPLLVRAGKTGVPGSPNFVRKPPPPAPPVRSVTRKDLAPSTTVPLAVKPVLQASPVPPQANRMEEQRQANKDGGKEEAEKNKEAEMVKSVHEKECAAPENENPGDQVYDTPPTNRWQHPLPAASVEEDDSIYNTPRAVPFHADPQSEIYDVPTHALNPPSDIQQETYSVPVALVVSGEVEEEDVYSVPSLPGLPLESGEMAGAVGQAAGNAEVYSVPSPGKTESASDDVSEADGGIYDMPALTLDVPSRRLSVSSTGSGDIQWKSSLSALIQSALSSASVSTVPSRDLAAQLAEILSVWKAGHVSDVPPPLQQIWSRLADLLPALSVCGTSNPTESLLSVVRRALEDAASLLQSQSRPRLPSQESLSRRPLPALPVAEVKPMAGGMGSRKGSWIQERPLPPPPPAAFPLPPAPASLPSAVQTAEDEEQGNEYAGIGLTPATPPAYPTGDSVGYVKLQFLLSPAECFWQRGLTELCFCVVIQGKPELCPDSHTGNGTSQLISTNDNRLSPSPPLPMSLSLEDSELLSFYSSQSLSHLSCLADAIDSLFSSVQGNQPPRIFVSRGKSLIVTAHKLVFIGDTLARLLSSSDLRAKVTTSSGNLCQALKAVVVATKGAAQNYPSVPATQEMVDRVADLSQQAAGFSGLLQRLAEIS